MQYNNITIYRIKYVQSANIIKELIDMKDGYCIKVLSDDECDIVIQYLSTE